jgi:hypothetical protein
VLCSGAYTLRFVFFSNCQHLGHSQSSGGVGQRSSVALRSDDVATMAAKARPWNNPGRRINKGTSSARCGGRCGKDCFVFPRVTPTDHLRTELYEKPVLEQAPVESAESALLERTESGTVLKPEFGQPLSTYLNDWLNPVTVLTSISSVKTPMDDPSRPMRNLEWLRLNSIVATASVLLLASVWYGKCWLY